MHKFSRQTDKLRILLSNDDGVAAKGLKILERVARTLSDDVWICAPATEQSGVGHSLTFRSPLWINKLSPRRFSVDGTPTDAVMMGVMELLKDRPPDLVLSGINRGGNAGDHVTYSGTVAAAMEATLLGVPAIALSQDLSDWNRVHWPTAEKHAPGLIRKLLRAGWRKRTFLNINFPDVGPNDVAGVAVCAQGERTATIELVEHRHPRGGRYYWISGAQTNRPVHASTDLAALARNEIAVTPVDVDLTDRRALKPLRAALGLDGAKK
jgi:5'-nucleotidase